jgi:hypothetical protein
MFGIATDSDVVVLTPFWNTEEEFAQQDDTYTYLYPSAKWSLPCRDFDECCEYTNDLQDEVNHYFFEDHSNESDSDFEERKSRLLKIFEESLVQLNKEGFFGNGKQRHRVLLQIDRGDCSDEETQWMQEVIKRINPPQSWTPLFEARKAEQEAEAAREREKPQQENRMKALAIAFLQQQKRPFDCYRSGRIEYPHPDLFKILGEKLKYGELWMLCFDAKDEPGGPTHLPGRLYVLVSAKTGKCAIWP